MSIDIHPKNNITGIISGVVEASNYDVVIKGIVLPRMNGIRDEEVCILSKNILYRLKKTDYDIKTFYNVVGSLSFVGVDLKEKEILRIDKLTMNHTSTKSYSEYNTSCNVPDGFYFITHYNSSSECWVTNNFRDFYTIKLQNETYTDSSLHIIHVHNNGVYMFQYLGYIPLNDIDLSRIPTVENILLQKTQKHIQYITKSWIHRIKFILAYIFL